MSGYKATQKAMGAMAKSLQRDPQLESILASRKRELGIEIESGAASAGSSPSITVSISAEGGASDFNHADIPPPARHATKGR